VTKFVRCPRRSDRGGTLDWVGEGAESDGLLGKGSRAEGSYGDKGASAIVLDAPDSSRQKSRLRGCDSFYGEMGGSGAENWRKRREVSSSNHVSLAAMPN